MFRAFTAYRRAAYSGQPAPRRQFMARESMLELLARVGELVALEQAA